LACNNPGHGRENIHIGDPAVSSYSTHESCSGDMPTAPEEGICGPSRATSRPEHPHTHQPLGNIISADSRFLASTDLWDRPRLCVNHGSCPPVTLHTAGPRFRSLSRTRLPLRQPARTRAGLLEQYIC
jgi:hypothetical protein